MFCPKCFNISANPFFAAIHYCNPKAKDGAIKAFYLGQLRARLQSLGSKEDGKNG